MWGGNESNERNERNESDESDNWVNPILKLIEENMRLSPKYKMYIVIRHLLVLVVEPIDKNDQLPISMY